MPRERILPFCEWCAEHRVKRKGSRFCSRRCAALQQCHRQRMHISREAAVLGRQRAVLAIRAKHHAKLRRYFLTTCQDIIGDRETVTLPEMVQAVTRIWGLSYQRGWNACWQRAYRTALKTHSARATHQ